MRASAGVEAADLGRSLELGNEAEPIGQQARFADVFDRHRDRKIYRLGEMLASK